MERKLAKLLPLGRFENVTHERSKTMGAIRSKNNKTTERALRMALIRSQIKGWNLHADLPGKPDFYFPRQRLAVFVDGCFWHRCPNCGHIPKTRVEFWAAKFERNRYRARKVSRQLRSNGIRVLRFWEHELKRNQSLDAVVLRIKRSIQRRRPFST